MAAIAYLDGGESPTAARLNALFTGANGLDAKLTKLLHGKSFFLAQTTAMPQRFCGKAFFFTSGATVYSQRVPGFVDEGGGVARPYDHAQFTSAVAGISSGVTYDETLKLASVPNFSTGLYDGLLVAANVGLLDHSLQAHYLMHQGSGDTEPVPYYIRESGRRTWERKGYRYALAEIILEGETDIELPAEWDKYNCFRVHNLNKVAATVDFAGGFTLNLAPLECRTVRRDSPTENYRAGGHYFFDFEGGDHRFYWFLPVRNMIGSEGSSYSNSGGDGQAVTNSMTANNLSNPAVLLDWVTFLARDCGSLGNPEHQAGWKLNAATQVSVAAHYENLFGDPSDPDTLLGDLLHHQGDIIIVKTHKTAVDGGGAALQVFDSVRFNGYATIVADFAAKGLTVAENGSGNYVVSAADPDYYISLVPIGTNLFKNGETRPSVVHLTREGATTPRTIESAIFEATVGGSLAASGPQSIFKPTITEIANTRTWYDTITDPDDPTPPEYTATGTPIRQLADTERSTALVINGVHNVTVADLLTLDYWGDPSVPDQDTTYRTYTNRACKLTPEGVVITFTQNETQVQRAGGADDYWQWALGNLAAVNKSIQFRGHGWGYVHPTDGSRASAWLSPRTGRKQVTEAFADELAGVSGVDYSLREDFTGSSTDMKVLTRIRTADLGRVSNGRFFQCTEPADRLASYLYFKATLTPGEFSTQWEAIGGGDIPAASGLPKLAMSLLPEQYNNLARYVNAIERGWPLNWRVLKWNIEGTLIGLGDCRGLPGNEIASEADIAGLDFPAPLEEYCHFPDDSLFVGLTTLLGIPVYTAANLPGGRVNGTAADFATLAAKRNRPQVVAIRREVTVSNATWNVTSSGETSGVPFQSGRFSCDVDLTIAVATAPANLDSGSPVELFGETYDASGSLGTAGVTAAAFNLNTAYAEYNWIKLSDVAEFLESIGFEFSYIESFRPLELVCTENLTNLDQRYQADRTIHHDDIGHAGAGLSIVDFTFLYNAVDDVWENSEGTLDEHLAGLNAYQAYLLPPLGTPSTSSVAFHWESFHTKLNFVSSSNPAWKVRIVTPPVGVCTVVNRSAEVGVEVNLAGLQQGLTVRAVPIFFSGTAWVMSFNDSTSPPSALATTIAHVAWEWAPSGSAGANYIDYVTQSYNETGRRDQHERLALQNLGDVDLVVRLLGVPSWRQPEDWWQTSLIHLVQAFVDPDGDNLGSHIYAASPVAFDTADTTVTAAPGLQVITAGTNARYLALFDPSQPSADLT